MRAYFEKFADQLLLIFNFRRGAQDSSSHNVLTSINNFVQHLQHLAAAIIKNLRRVLMIGLEFSEPSLSRNGMLARSLVLLLLSQYFDVAVLCGQSDNVPSSSFLASNSTNHE